MGAVLYTCFRKYGVWAMGVNRRIGGGASVGGGVVGR